MILIVVSTGHFDPLLAECERLRSKYDFFGQIGSSLVVPSFPHVRMLAPNEIEQKMKDAELVISHGGAGMTAMIHRLKKRSVIIPKQRRYGEPNDLQVELALKWKELEMGVVILDVEDLDAAIENCRQKTPHFPEFPKLGSHLNSVLKLDPPSVAQRFKLAGY